MDTNAIVEPVQPNAGRSGMRGRIAVLRIGRLRLAGLLLLTVVLLLSIVVPMVSRYAPNAMDGLPLRPPSWAHPFGTDDYGRDVFVRTWAAGRIDLFIVTVTVLCSLTFGTTIGVMVASAKRRIWDLIAMRIVDAVVAFPFTVLVLAIVLLLGSTRSLGILPAGLPALFVAIFVWDWAIYARLARAQTLTLRKRDFITAAHLIGFSWPRIVRAHLLPNVIRTTASYAVTDAMVILVTTAGLPFLGAGVQPPTPEWGAMMFEGRVTLSTAWWVVFMPGLALALTGVGLSLFADAIPSLKRR